MPKVKPSVTLLRYTEKPEQTVAIAAKLCYSSSDVETLVARNDNSDVSKFIGNLISMGHLSPLEHASFTFGLEGVSRSLLAQITRHRIASFSVKSQRYVSEKGSFNYIIPRGIEKLGEEAVAKFEKQMETVQGWYNESADALGMGESSYEDARFVLPNASETKMIVTMNARELLHFFELRCCNRAQWEIREVAWQMLGLVYGVAPELFACAGPSCCKGGCTEGAKTCGRAAEMKKRFAALKDKKQF